jgi:hypothetical protein
VAVIASGGTAFVYVLDPAARPEIEATVRELASGVALESTASSDLGDNPYATSHGNVRVGPGEPSAKSSTTTAAPSTPSSGATTTSPGATTAGSTTTTSSGASTTSSSVIAKILGPDEVAATGGDRNAAFVLVAAPGYAFSDARTGPIIVDTPGRGTHGWPPSDPAMAASFIAVGPNIAHRELGKIRMVDIAPTIARWLGVALPDATGTPML